MTELELSDSEEERLISRRKEKAKAFKDNQRKLLADHERKWLQRRGKSHYIDFDDTTRSDLRRCFKSIAKEGADLIRIDELMEPLLALGIAETRDQVMQLFEGIDAEGLMEFERFLSVLKNQGIADVFKAIARGNLLPLTEQLPFPLVISNYRRRMMMNAFMDGVNSDERVKGEKIMRAYAKLLDNRFQGDDYDMLIFPPNKARILFSKSTLIKSIERMDSSPFARQSTLREHMNNLKQQISDLTKDLEQQVSSGYFDILCSAQNLADLSSRLSDLPNLLAPAPPQVIITSSTAHQVCPKSPYESIWLLIEAGRLQEAVEELLNSNINDETLEIVDYILLRFRQDLPEASTELTDEILQTLTLIARAFGQRPEGDCLLAGENAAVQFYFDALKSSFDKVTEDAGVISRSLQAYQKAKLNYESCVKKFCSDEPLSFDGCLEASKHHMLGLATRLLNSAPSPQSVMALYSIKHTDLWDDFKAMWLQVTSSLITSSLDSVDWLSVTRAEALSKTVDQIWTDLKPALDLLEAESLETFTSSLDKLKAKLAENLKTLSATASSDNLLAWYVGLASLQAFHNDYSFLSLKWVEASAQLDFMQVLRQARLVCGSLIALCPEGLPHETSQTQHVYASVLKVPSTRPALPTGLDEAPELGPADELSLPPRFFPHLVLS